jgi:hypothetical protein
MEVEPVIVLTAPVPVSMVLPRPPKTPSSYRTVPLPQLVVDALAAHLAVFSAAQVELLDMTCRPEPEVGGMT